MNQGSFPPPGYVKSTSKVAGIDVYVPAQAVDNRPDVVEFKCPQCGASTAYNPTTGGLACSFCGYRETLDTVSLGRAAHTFEFKVETLEKSEHGWGVERKEMACQGCGALVSAPPDSLSYTCPFCGSNKVLYREPLADALRPRYIIPFSVDPATCQAATREWLHSSWMTPAQLKTAARVDNFTPIYIPYWTFSARCNAQWKAQIGREVTEHYTVNGEHHTRTRIEWRWKSGVVQREFEDLLVPGTSRLNLAALAKIDSFAVRDLVLYDPKLLAGIQSQAYDITLEQAWEAGRAVMRDRTRETCYDRTGSSHVRDFSMSLDFADEAWRYILVPVYTSVYSYGQKTYQILVNGQSGKIAGPRPVDWNKVWLVIAALLAPGAVLGIIGLLTLLLQIGVVIGGIGLFLLAVGLVISFFIFTQAQEMENVHGNAANLK